MANKRWQTSPEYNRILLSPDGDKVSVQPVHEESISARGPSSLERAVKLDNAPEDLKLGLMTDLLERAGEVS